MPLRGQISPGPLSKVHQDLDSPLKCTQCHVFGAGTAKLRCSNCHRAIREAVAQRQGYHGRVVNATKGDSDCARCHTEHYGRIFSVIRWPTSKDDFDHRETGYPLEGAHARLRCDQCHNAGHISEAQRKKIRAADWSRTFLGLSTACLTCHADRHNGQLGADCRRCHGDSRWKPVQGFDHAASRYPLTGRHQQVQCAQCHPPAKTDAKVVQYSGLNFADCSGCHRDPHRGAFAARCESCHGTDGWRRVRSLNAFDHSRTPFPLAGKHADVACLKCHTDANFKAPVVHALCRDCHRDPHQGQFRHRADRGECAFCHTESGFQPAKFSAADHGSTGFPVAGKHREVACAKCHEPHGRDTQYHPAFQACLDCHRDPHGGQFARAPSANRCQDCHTDEGFLPSTFSLARHQTSSFPLKGAHAAVACGECHGQENTGADRRFHFVSVTCGECHRDPHSGEFPAAMKTANGQDLCESCHGLRSWRELKSFEHSTSGFPLTGAHFTLACTECHTPRDEAAGVRRLPFQSAPERCAGCHEDIHGGQFQNGDEPADCARCHTTARWAAAVFDHDTRTSFTLKGVHTEVPCRLCHFERRPHNGRMMIVYKGTPRECRTCHR